MKIALDYDKTFTAAPMFFGEVIKLAKEHGHSVTFVTYRQGGYGNEDIEADANHLDIDIVFTGGKQKQHIFEADIWIDDSPETVPSAEKLGDCMMVVSTSMI